MKKLRILLAILGLTLLIPVSSYSALLTTGDIGDEFTETITLGIGEYDLNGNLNETNQVLSGTVTVRNLSFENNILMLGVTILNSSEALDNNVTLTQVGFGLDPEAISVDMSTVGTYFNEADIIPSTPPIAPELHISSGAAAVDGAPLNDRLAEGESDYFVLAFEFASSITELEFYPIAMKFQTDSGSYQVNNVPIPTTIFLLSSGLLGLAGVSRKKTV